MTSSMKMRHFRFEVPLFLALMITWVHGQECGNVVLNANSGTFTTPNYPGKYDHNLDCKWTIKAPEDHTIRLKFNHFDVGHLFPGCNIDYITIDIGDGSPERYCTDKDHRPDDEDFTSLKNILKMTLKSDAFFTNGQGFSAFYEVLDKNGEPLDKKEEEEEEEDTEKPEKDKPLTKTTTVAVTTTENLEVTTTTEPVSTTTEKPSLVTKKPRGKGRKGKGKKKKKNRKSKAERKLERQLRRERKKALKAKNGKVRKGRRGKKAKRSSRGSASE